MFQAWLVKIANTAASSAPSTRPGASDRKNTTVTERKPRIGTECKLSRRGISTMPARRLLAAHVAYVKVNRSERTIAASMRSVVRAAYPGRLDGSREGGDEVRLVSGWRDPPRPSAR